MVDNSDTNFVKIGLRLVAFVAVLFIVYITLASSLLAAQAQVNEGPYRVVTVACGPDEICVPFISIKSMSFPECSSLKPIAERSVYNQLKGIEVRNVRTECIPEEDAFVQYLLDKYNLT